MTAKMKGHLKSFIGGSKKRPATPSSTGSANAEKPESVLHDFELEPHGLFVLHPTPEVYVAASALEADIVAIHGLNGTARKTWTEPSSGNFWLEDFLPDAFPKARIMTFGYDSALAFSRSQSGVENFARDLLNRLKMLRCSYEARDRPLVFIAHSLGGIVVKKALVLAHEAADCYGSVLNSTKGIVFMGTPHRGSELVPWALLFSNLVNVASLGRGIRKALLRSIDRDSDMLGQISRQFIHRATNLKLMSFVEQQAEPPLTSLVVPEYSAVLNLHNEMIIPMNAHHRNICRFSSRQEQGYMLVEAAIREIIFGQATVHSESTQQGQSLPLGSPDRPPSKGSRDPSALLRSAVKRPVDIQPAAANPITSANGAPSITSQNVIDRSSVSASSQVRTEIPTSSNYDQGSESPPLSKSQGSLQIIDRRMRSLRLSDSIQSSDTSSVGSSVISDSDTGIPSPSAGPSFQFETVTFRISGLRLKLNRDNYRSERTCSHVLRLPSESPVSDLSALLHRRLPAVGQVSSFKFHGEETTISDIWRDIFTTPVQVTAGRPSYDKLRGLKINQAQQIASFFSRAFPEPLEAKLASGIDDDENSNPVSRASSQWIRVGRGGQSELVISFQRTIRIPEDSKNYDLPPGLGHLPLFNICPFSDKLPPGMVAQGGLFMPMYQFEAMWIYFQYESELCRNKFVIRPFLGGVNGISGEATAGNMGTILRQKNARKQDYIVLPEQRWLDGISTQPGVVKQFVATEMAPPRENLKDEPTSSEKENVKHKAKSHHGDAETKEEQHKPIGASIEWQVTGKDEVGGLQLQIIPVFDVERMSVSSLKNYIGSIEDCRQDARKFDVLNTAEEEGLRAGDTIHVKDMKHVAESRAKLLGDLLKEAQTKLTAQDVVELDASRDTTTQWTFNISIYQKSEASVTLSFEDDDDFGDVMMVMKHEMQSEGALCFPSTANNGSQALEPLRSWNDLQNMKEGSENTGVYPLHELQYPKGLQMQDLVWVSRGSTGLSLMCHVSSDVEVSPTYSDDTPLRIGLGQGDTIADLRRELEKATGLSTSAYEISSDLFAVHADAYKVFGDSVDMTTFTPPKFSLIYSPHRDGKQSKGSIVIKVLPTDSNGTITVQCQPDWTIEMLKGEIEQNNSNFPRGSQRLLLGDKSLDSNKYKRYTLSSLGIKNGDTLRLEGPFCGIYIRRLMGQTFSIKCEMTETVEDVKAKIQDQERIPAVFQRLIFNGKQLEDGRTLSEYNIRKETTVNLAMRLYGGGKGGEWICIRYNGSVENIACQGKIADIKLAIHKRLGIPSERQSLFSNGVVVNDDESSKNYGGIFLDLVADPEPHPQQLGVGAGGSIIQTIERDTNDPRIWDVGSSRILNVQIVDARTFQLVTGLEPPPTPITAETYKDLGLPLYQNMPSGNTDKESAVGGATWGDIMGAAEVAEKKLQTKVEVPGIDNSVGASQPSKNVGAGGQQHEEENSGGKGQLRGEESFDFPVILLAVDDSMPKFKSIAEDQDDWEGM